MNRHSACVTVAALVWVAGMNVGLVDSGAASARADAPAAGQAQDQSPAKDQAPAKEQVSDSSPDKSASTPPSKSLSSMATDLDNASAKAGGANAPASQQLGAWQQLVKDFSKGGRELTAKVDPCRDVVMRFVFPAEVAEVLVKGGERVKMGQLLCRARDTDIKAAIEQQRITAASDLEVQGARANADLAKFRFDQLKAGGVFTPEDFERARAESITTQVQFEQAQLNARLQQVRLDQLIGQYERYRLEAPFDGVVENVLIEVGKAVGESVDALRIVNTDNLWLDAYPETDETIRLRLATGSPAWVLLNLPDRPVMVRGKVLYVSPAADYVGQSRRVRVEIPNPADYPAGLQSAVRFTQPSAEWDAYLAEPGAGENGPGGKVRGNTTSQLDEPAFMPPFQPPQHDHAQDRASHLAQSEQRIAEGTR